MPRHSLESRTTSWLAKLSRVLKKPAIKKAQVDVSWVSDRVIQKLNLKHRGRGYVTDVLSFPAPKIFVRAGYLGELILCKNQTLRQAKECGHTVSDETDILIVHGLLHLLGFDHERGARAAAHMQKMERAVLGSKKHGLIARSASVTKKS